MLEGALLMLALALATTNAIMGFLLMQATRKRRLQPAADVMGAPQELHADAHDAVHAEPADHTSKDNLCFKF